MSEMAAGVDTKVSVQKFVECTDTQLDFSTCSAYVRCSTSVSQTGRFTGNAFVFVVVLFRFVLLSVLAKCTVVGSNYIYSSTVCTIGAFLRFLSKEL